LDYHTDLKTEFENRPDTKESRYIHHDFKDIDPYQYDETVMPRLDLDAR
jgi:hypothetical protein